MAENVNVGAIAEELPKELFKYFYWGQSGRMNYDWPCEKVDEHSKKEHPCDAVFYYDEPYKSSRTYVHTDLKSYSRESINKTSVEKAIESLAKQVSCANVSSNWRSEHAHSHIQHEVHGLLFIYNHDETYDKNFKEILDSIESPKTLLPKGSRVYVLGPEDINWLMSIKTHLKLLRGSSEGFTLPDQESCYFYYPQLARKPNVALASARAATLETMLSPWMILCYNKEEQQGTVVYYRREAMTEEQFIYLIDYLRFHDLLKEGQKTHVAFPRSQHDEALPLLQRAKQRYIEDLKFASKDSQLAKNIDKISSLKIPKIIESYSSYELGMRYE